MKWNFLYQITAASGSPDYGATAPRSLISLSSTEFVEPPPNKTPVYVRHWMENITKLLLHLTSWSKTSGTWKTHFPSKQPCREVGVQVQFWQVLCVWERSELLPLPENISISRETKKHRQLEASLAPYMAGAGTVKSAQLIQTVCSYTAHLCLSALECEML